MARASTTSMSSVHAPVDRYFHPASQHTVTITPDSSVDAVRTAPARIAPDEIPAKMPTSVSRRVHSMDSRGRDDALAVEELGPAVLDEDRRDVAVVEVAQSVDELAGRRLDGEHLDVRVPLLQVAADAEQRARGAEAGDEVGDLGAVAPDLGTGALVVGPGVGRVGVLVEEGPLGVLGGQGAGPAHGTVRTLGPGRLDDLGAPRLEQLPALDGDVGGEHHLELVALDPAHQCHADAGVARRRLDERGPRVRIPSRSACSIIASAMRSLTEPPGFWPSSFMRIRTSGLGLSAVMSTSGVLPMRSRTDP